MNWLDMLHVSEAILTGLFFAAWRFERKKRKLLTLWLAEERVCCERVERACESSNVGLRQEMRERHDALRQIKTLRSERDHLQRILDLERRACTCGRRAYGR
jgi:dsDNA-binding SOS-regulon protein